MTRFIIRRLIYSIPVLIGIVMLVFILARVIPGDPCTATYGEKATPELCAQFEIRYGLDKPIWEQFLIYLGALLQGDLGSSIRFGRPVTDILLERLPVTVELTVVALLFATVVGVTLGLLSATRRNSPVDVGTMVLANLGVSTPVFVLGLLLAFVFAVLLKDTFLALPPSGRLSPGVTVIPLAESWGLQELSGAPRSVLDFFSNIYTFNTLVTGQWETFADAARHLILPAIAVGTIPLAIIARMTRSSLLEVLGLDYVRTARAKGLKERSVVLRHGMRNALLPVVTVIGLSLGAFLSGAILTETIFNLTGMGKTLFEAIQGRDYIVIQGVTIVVALAYLTVNLIVDVSYAFLDPRIRLS
ncbi:MAG: ABC transporter permease [Chloroflexota bacterium]|jgi:peptide/nickel transport system permease protein|nr:ABC transporter permease [Chloroflexota bacterium]MDH5244112.1 ABC transporter permease [Chloroflexota bacterium]